MFDRKSYTGDELDHTAAAVAQQLAAYRDLVAAVDSAPADADVRSALEALEPVLFNNRRAGISASRSGAAPGRWPPRATDRRGCRLAGDATPGPAQVVVRPGDAPARQCADARWRTRRMPTPQVGPGALAIRAAGHATIAGCLCLSGWSP